MEHPRLPEFPTFGTFTSDVDEYYPEQAKNDNQLRLKALGERENEEYFDETVQSAQEK